MILQSLHALYDRLVDEKAYALPKPGFSSQQIAFKVVLRPDGTLLGIQDARVPNAAGKRVPVRLDVPGEAKPSGAGVNPGFLWDNQTYLLGRQPADKPAGFGQKRFEAFRRRHLEAESAVSQPEFSAVCRFLEGWTPEQIAGQPLLEEVGTGFGAFQIVGEPGFVHDVAAVRNWWMDRLPAATDASQGQCLLSGETAVIARLHPKIKGVLGAQSAGALLVSFNDNSYESYGREQSYNSPVGETAAFRYGTALNALLSGPMSAKHRLRIGDSTCVFWTDRPSVVEDVFAEFASAGSAAEEKAQDGELRQKIHLFLSALQKGQGEDRRLGDDPEGTRFYLLGLAPNAARLSVRFFYQSTVRELLDHLRQHQADSRVVRQFERPVGKRSADPEFPAWWEFLRATVRQGDDPSPLLGGALMRAILEGTPYPETLLGATVRRVQLERSVPYLRAASIKAVLVRNHQLALLPMLDPDNTRPAYLLGRLFAVLEKVQEDGHREQTGGRTLDKTIRDTYFAAACATPGSVFPRLQVLSTHHRRHLSYGSRVFFDNLIGGIMAPIPAATGYPRAHTLEDQGVFILGYYHQRKALFTRRETAPESSEVGTVAEAVA